METAMLKIPYQDRLSDDELLSVCEANPEWRIERDSKGQLIIMSPVGSFSSNKNFKLNFLFGSWVETHTELGYGFDSSAGFTLPDLSMRSPDASWIRKERWESLSAKQQKVFAPICPDFVIELRSESDSIQMLKEKMLEWIKNGCQLGWLIDPLQQKTYVYKSDRSILEINGFDKKLSGETLLPGFELDLSRLK